MPSVCWVCWYVVLQRKIGLGRKDLLIVEAETDFITPTLIQDMISTLPGSEFPYKFIVYGGTRHGFASRADMNDEIGRRTLLDSFNDSVRWISSF